ncbi:Luciferase-like monooxygenase [Halorubrum aquaticum]|uniref:Luciferase-like monooxygenase n=1 Tax=Halorubrum aquaticum TaxID=387340 RepID=A0A1I3B614_9EURY|nr:LLM class flavin-dependent oxidoreductase [Halorubrum aquaticum]SFH57141.1 Luciferase-like monooxygenase [Halorubrum aquaticum]
MLTGSESEVADDANPMVRAGIDAAALKPAECDVTRAVDLPVDRVAIDYEGREHFPDAATLEAIAAEKSLYVTTPVRADGFDPLGDDSLLDRIPDRARRLLVAGHGAYLDESESSRAIAPRFGAAREAAPDAWIGTEGVERLALAAGGTQYELLSRSTDRDARALRAAGFDGEIAVYAPTVLTDDEDAVLDGVGAYVSRRRPVARALPDGGEGADGEGGDAPPTDATATGRTREVLSAAARDFALVGSPETVRERVEELREAGVDRVVGYPARGIDEFLS